MPPVPQDQSTVSESSFDAKSARVSITEANKAFHFRVPLAVLMLLFITTSVVSVGVIGWKVTYDSATVSVAALASQIQARASDQIIQAIVGASLSIIKIAQQQRSNWRTNKWSHLPERRNETWADMLNFQKQFSNWTADMYYETYPAGEIFGYFYTSDIYYQDVVCWQVRNHSI